MKKQLQRIKEKMKKLRDKDAHELLFGASTHHYQLNEPLTTAEVAQFEEDYKIQLPTQYKAFLTELGDGGAGPGYGLMPLQIAVEKSAQIGKPFTYTADDPCMLEQCVHFNVEMEKNLSADKLEKLQADKEKYIQEEYEKATEGIVFLSGQGFGMYDVMVVHGEGAGSVWWFNFADEVGVIPYQLEHGEPLGFLDWYELNLDAYLDGQDTATTLKYLKLKKHPNFA